MWIDVPGYPLSSGLITKVHNGRYQATTKQRKKPSDVGLSKSSTYCNFLWEISSLLRREPRIRSANRDYIFTDNRDLDH